MKPVVVTVITDDDVVGQALGGQLSCFRSFARADNIKRVSCCLVLLLADLGAILGDWT